MAANATWAGGVVYAYDPTLTASVDPGFGGAGAPLVVGSTGLQHASFAAAPTVFRILDQREWFDRRLPNLTDFEPQAAVDEPQELHQIDSATFATVHSIVLDASLRAGPFTLWRP